MALEALKKRQIGFGVSDFSVTKCGVQVKLLLVPVSVHENVGQWTFLSQPTDRRTLDKLVVPSHYFPPASTTETKWEIAIVNYHMALIKGNLNEETHTCVFS